MAIKKVFVDEDGNEMQCFINIHGKLVIEIGVPASSEFYPYYNGLICLTKEDAEFLVLQLRDLIKKIDE